MNYDEYTTSLVYLESLLASERVLVSRLDNLRGFFDINVTIIELKRVQSEITYLKQTQPELFL